MTWLDNWGFIYGLESETFKFLHKIHETFYLINVVDNNYVSGDLTKTMSSFIEENAALIKELN